MNYLNKLMAIFYELGFVTRLIAEAEIESIIALCRGESRDELQEDIKQLRICKREILLHGLSILQNLTHDLSEIDPKLINPTYYRLIWLVDLVDSDASNYIAGPARELDSFNAHATYLHGLFRWDETPQGHDYWMEINRQIAALGVE